MGACYSKQGHDAALSPKHKSPHHKHHKNGVAIKIEYTPVRPQEDDRLSIIQKHGDDIEDANGNQEKTELLMPSPVKAEIDVEEKGEGVAPSDSGIESLAANDNVTGHLDNLSSHSREENGGVMDDPDQNKDKNHQTGETYCTCGPRSACKQQWKLNNDPAKTGETSPESPTCQNAEGGVLSLENVNVEVPRSASRLSQEIRRFDSEASLELSSAFSSMHEVRTMQLDGKEVVVIDVEMYCQIMEEIEFLKMKLSQLTELIQDQEQLSPTDSHKARSPSLIGS